MSRAVVTAGATTVLAASWHGVASHCFPSWWALAVAFAAVAVLDAAAWGAAADRWQMRLAAFAAGQLVCHVSFGFVDGRVSASDVGMLVGHGVAGVAVAVSARRVRRVAAEISARAVRLARWWVFPVPRWPGTVHRGSVFGPDVCGRLRPRVAAGAVGRRGPPAFSTS